MSFRYRRRISRRVATHHTFNFDASINANLHLCTFVIGSRSIKQLPLAIFDLAFVPVIFNIFTPTSFKGTYIHIAIFYSRTWPVLPFDWKKSVLEGLNESWEMLGTWVFIKFQFSIYVHNTELPNMIDWQFAHILQMQRSVRCKLQHVSHFWDAFHVTTHVYHYRYYESRDNVELWMYLKICIHTGSRVYILKICNYCFITLLLHRWFLSVIIRRWRVTYVENQLVFY